MTTRTAEQAIVTLTITSADGTTSITRITDSEVATDPLAQAAAMASSLVRLRPEVTVAVTANEAARHQHPTGGTRSGFSGSSRAPARRPTG